MEMVTTEKVRATYIDSFGNVRSNRQGSMVLTMSNESVSKDALLDRIARESLGVETLATRNSDSSDFYDLAVWQIREALEAAYEAGRGAK